MKTIAIVVLALACFFLIVLGSAYFKNGFYGWKDRIIDFRLMGLGTGLIVGGFICLLILNWLIKGW